MSVTIKTAKLSTLIENLQDLLEKEGDIPVVMSSDEEGNSFNTFDPTGDTSYGCEGGILILYPSSERIDLDDLDGYKYDEDDEEEDYDSYDDDDQFNAYDIENDGYN